MRIAPLRRIETCGGEAKRGETLDGAFGRGG